MIATWTNLPRRARHPAVACIALAALAGAVGLAGCGGGSASGGGGDDAPADARAFCQAVSAAWADREATCWPVDRAQAASTADFALSCRSIVRAEALGTVRYDPAEAKACLEAFRTERCDAYRADGAPPDRCRAAVAPATPVGGLCWTGALDLECVGGWCHFEETACGSPGRCEAWLDAGADCSAGGRCGPGFGCDGATCVALPEPGPFSGAGTLCDLPGVACAPGLVCGLVGAERRCTAPLTEGPCLGDSHCAEGFDCRCQDDACTASACLPVLGRGDACTPGRHDCSAGLRCGAAGTCLPGPGVGEPCADPAAEDARCVGGWCEITFVPLLAAPARPVPTGICRPFGLLGGACGAGGAAAAREECGPGAACEFGRCVVSTCGTVFLR